MREWVMAISDSKRLNNASINRAKSSIRSLYKFMRREGIIENDIFATIQSLRTKKRIPKFINEEYLAKVVEKVLSQLHSEEWQERRDALLVLMLYTCGIRLAEVVAIDHDHFSRW